MVDKKIYQRLLKSFVRKKLLDCYGRKRRCFKREIRNRESWLCSALSGSLFFVAKRESGGMSIGRPWGVVMAGRRLVQLASEDENDF